MMNCDLQLAGACAQASGSWPAKLSRMLSGELRTRGVWRSQTAATGAFRRASKLRLTQKRMCRYKYMIFRRLSPFFTFFHPFFTLFFSHKALVFRRLQQIPGYKRRQEQKIKCENGKRGGFIGESGRHEFGGCEIFRAKPASRANSELFRRDAETNPRDAGATPELRLAKRGVNGDFRRCENFWFLGSG
jgi:hypothetical protein